MIRCDYELVASCKRFIQTQCRLSKAPFAGKLIELLPWQEQLIEGLYLRWDGDRPVTKTASVWLPKKNCKSPTGSSLACFNLVRYPGNDIYIIAPTHKQAGIIFNECAAMVEQNPALDRKQGGRFWVRRNLKIIEDRKRYSKIEVLSCSPEISGFSAGLIICDELAEWPKCYAQDVLDKIANAIDARPYGQIVTFSTAQYDKEHPGYHNYRLAKQVLKGEIKDRPDIFPLIYEVEEHADWKNIAAVLKANPAYPKVLSRETIEADLKKVESDPREEARVRTFRCNQWVGSADQFIPYLWWSNCKTEYELDDLRERDRCWFAMDYAKRYDLAAYSIVCERGENYLTFTRFFMPREFAEKKQRLDNVPYIRKGGWLDDPKSNLVLTDGKTIKPQLIKEYLLDDFKKFRPKEIAFDNWGMQETMDALAKAGLPIVDCPQGMAVMGPGVIHMYNLIKEGRLKHPGNPILDFCVGNAVARYDTQGEGAILDKRRSTARIDGLQSIAIACSRIVATKKVFRGSVSIV